MMRSTSKATLLLVAALTARCSGGSTSADGGFVDGPAGDGGFVDAGFPDEDPFVNTFHPTLPDPRGPGSIEPIDVIACREPQRLSVDHIRQSIPFAFAGTHWDLGVPPAEGIDILNILSRTLGEADYVTVTSDDREPSPLFMKFMDNMASKVCINAVLHDWNAAVPPEDRVLRRYEDPLENLRYLRLKLHTIYVPEGSTDGIEDLYQLYQDLEPLDPYPQLEDPRIFQWIGVCVAMLTAPEFFAY